MNRRAATKINGCKPVEAVKLMAPAPIKTNDATAFCAGIGTAIITRS
jgi:hypothetical protein